MSAIEDLRNELFRAKGRLSAPVTRAARSRRRFTFAGQTHPYFIHPYHTTWRSERTVEVPIALAALARRRPCRALELGNVLAHYGEDGHDVVDRYEVAPGVRNEDIADAALDPVYDLVLSVSTLEHVGFDEDIEEPDKPVRAVERLVAALAPGGELLVTVPLGYNHHLDTALREGRFGFDQVGYMRRVTGSNRWQEVDAADARRARYGYPFPNGNVIAIAGSRRSA